MGASKRGSTGSFCFITAAPNSGSLIRADVFTSAGFFDEAMFIDYVDVDYCLRVQKNGFRILSVSGVVLGHELGTQESRNVLGRRISFRVHTAWRYYYIMRNRVVMYGRHGRSFPRWMLHDAFWVILELGRISCLESDKLRKLRCALHGLWDGLCGRQGRHPLFP
jgi:rhamnosyltransferase